MSMTDPIADLLTRIRNAQLANHETVELPGSRMKRAIVEIMQREGYLESCEFDEGAVRSRIRIRLKYTRDGAPAIEGLERVSRPGRRVYRGRHAIPRVIDGMGITIVSTPRGLMTGATCQQQGIGGEVLLTVW
jgi:small subunit ribosomal protein S8